MGDEIEEAEARFNELVREWGTADELCRHFFRHWEAAKRDRKALKREKNEAWAHLQAIRAAKAVSA